MFWKSSGPDPLTPNAERLVTHAKEAAGNSLYMLDAFIDLRDQFPSPKILEANWEYFLSVAAFNFACQQLIKMKISGGRKRKLMSFPRDELFAWTPRAQQDMVSANNFMLQAYLHACKQNFANASNFNDHVAAGMWVTSQMLNTPDWAIKNAFINLTSNTLNNNFKGWWEIPFSAKSHAA